MSQLDLHLQDFEGWGTGVLCAGDSHVLTDNPAVVLSELLNSDDEGFLQFTVAAGYEGDNKVGEEGNYLPRRPMVLRADQIDIVEALPPSYMSYYEDPERDA